MVEWRRSKLSEYIFVGIVIFVVIACLLPTCNFNPSIKRNESMAKVMVTNIISSQQVYYEKFGRYGSSEDLVSSQSPLNAGECLGNKYGYQINVKSNGKAFQITATPVNYGRSGKLSYYADNNDFKVRAADHQGQLASITDPLIKE